MRTNYSHISILMAKKNSYSKLFKISLIGILLLSVIPSLFGKTPTVNLIYPNSETFSVGQTINFQWSSTNQNHYGIYLYKGGTTESHQISRINITNGNNDYGVQSYSWTITETVLDEPGVNTYTLNGDDYKFKIVIWDTDDAATATPIGDFSSSYITINPKPIVTDVSPSDAILGESETFTISGTNLNNDMVYYIDNFGSGTVDASSYSTYKKFTIASSDNCGIKYGEIKMESGGEVLKDFEVAVYFPIPSNFTATANGTSQIDLSWSSVSNAYQYKLYRANSSNGIKTNIYTGSNNSYSNVSLSENTTYYYWVQACQAGNQNSCSSQSAYESATTGQAVSNHAPDNPSFRPLPSGFQYTVNAASSIPIKSSSDQDGDQTKVHMWCANSANPQNNQYISSYSTSVQNYNLPITFTVSGDQTVYIQSFDINGASSDIIHHIYSIQEENTDENPLVASFISFPDQATENQSLDFTVQSGTDPNNDQTKVMVWASHSNYTEASAYATAFANGGQQFTIPLTFSQEGTETVYCQTMDEDGNVSSITSRSISVISGTSEITEVQIAYLTLTAANIVETSSNIFSLSGNVIANDIIQFTGTVVADLNDLRISGNGRVYLSNIPNFNTDVDLYNGSFEYDIPNNSSELIAVGLDEANELLTMANLPVYIDRISLLSDGINITGNVEFPYLLGYARAEVTELQITKSKGLELVGEMEINEIQASGFKLKEMKFAFNTITDEFSGNGKIETALFKAGANISILSTGIDEIGMFLSLSNPYPLGTTGLALSGLTGNISNIQSHPNPPMIITFGTSLTAVGTPPEVLELKDVSLTYQFGTSLSGNGTFKVLGKETASAGFEVREGLFKIYAEVNFYDVINAAIEAGIVANENNSVDVFAKFSASMQLPDGEGFPYSWIDPFVSLPYTFANFENILYNTELSGKGMVDIFIFDAEFSYLLTYSNGVIHKEFAKNYSLFTGKVFIGKENKALKFETPSKSLSDWNSPEYNRFEGQSLIIDPKDYSDSKNAKGEIIQDFILSGSVETLVVRVELESGDPKPEYSITTPSGLLVNADNINEFEDYSYSVNNDNNGVYYTINNAEAGAWILTLIDNGKTQFADIFGTEDEPGIIINGIQKTGNDVAVSWVDDNPNFDGQISLYYDYNNSGIDGSLIVSGLSENDETDSFTFDVTGFSPGEYYVYAIMFDENGVPVTSYSNEPFVVQGNISAPTNLVYSLNTQNNIELDWELIADGNDYEYMLYYEKEGEVSFGSQNINTGNNSSSYTFSTSDEAYAYQFMVVAKNANGELGQASNWIAIDLARHQTIELNQGWNLIGLSIEPTDPSISKTFESLSDKLLQIKDETKSYDPNLPDYLNTLENVENGKGYWIKLSEAGQLTSRGKGIELLDFEIALHEGWNLISYPAQYSKDIEQALVSISGKIVQVKNVENSYDPLLPEHLNTLKELKPGEGYWINVNQDCVLTF
ncbi:MAG: hypothetical protein JEZ09_02295 [Salinivirgaceae bacterium]|nr:hypothetical protein [Salinivirgaceae bacterium]